MLNKMNNKMMHDKLFAMQEGIKSKRGIKNKSKELQSFAKGGPAGYNAAGFMIDPRFAGEISMGVSAPAPRKVRDTWGIKGDITAPWDNYGRVSEVNVDSLPEVVETVSAPKKRPVKRTAKTTKPIIAPEVNPDLTTIDEDYSVEATPGDISTRIISTPIVEPVINKPTYINKPDWRSTVGDLFGDLASLAPIMSNLFTGRPEAV
jgi:hypothetical protein